MIKGSKGIIDACLHAIRCIPFDPHIIIINIVDKQLPT